MIRTGQASFICVKRVFVIVSANPHVYPYLGQVGEQWEGKPITSPLWSTHTGISCGSESCPRKGFEKSQGTERFKKLTMLMWWSKAFLSSYFPRIDTALCSPHCSAPLTEFPPWNIQSSPMSPLVSKYYGKWVLCRAPTPRPGNELPSIAMREEGSRYFRISGECEHMAVRTPNSPGLNPGSASLQPCDLEQVTRTSPAQLLLSVEWIS